MIDEEATEVIKGHAGAIEELLTTEEVMGQAEETVLIAELEVIKGQTIVEDETELVLVTWHSSFELVEVVAKGQAEALEVVTVLLIALEIELLLVIIVETLLLNIGQALALLELAEVVELETVLFEAIVTDDEGAIKEVIEEVEVAEETAAVAEL